MCSNCKRKVGLLIYQALWGGGGRPFNYDGQAQFFCFCLTTGLVILANNFKNRFKNSDPYHPYPTRILPSLIQLRCYLLIFISDLTFSYPTQILHSLIQLRSYILLSNRRSYILFSNSDLTFSSNSDLTISYPTEILPTLTEHKPLKSISGIQKMVTI